jgi:hypothetical protein
MDDNKPKYGYTPGEVDNVVPRFPPAIAKVTPVHPDWKNRVKLEIGAILKYLQFIKNKGARPWFHLTPFENPKYNFMIWKGFLTIPERPDILFNIRILLTSEYPKVSPRCFAELRISNYCGKMYLKNVWNDPEDGKDYIMLCHDHMAEQEAWEDDLGIAHFFIREVWYWWSAMQNMIIKEFDLQKHV